MGKIIEKIAEKINPEIIAQQNINIGCKLSFQLMSNNSVLFCYDGKNINWFHSYVKFKDNTIISTKKAKRESYNLTREDDNYIVDITYSQNKIKLIQHIVFKENDSFFTIQLQIKSSKEITSNEIAPLDFCYPDNHCLPFFSNLNERMLYIPYDNDMWSWYEVAPLSVSRASYDVSVIFDKNTNEGILLGALDFDFWKNAIRCSNTDARCFTAYSGASDASTHDCLPHGYASGNSIASSTFVCGYYQNIYDGLEQYGKLATSPNGLKWNHGVIFGWNSYSALATKMTTDHYLAASTTLAQLDNFKTEENVTYINFDATINISSNQMKEAVNKIHKNKQKAGTYIAPLCHLPIMDLLPLKGSLLHFRKEIVLKKPDGTNYDPIDGKYPIDITHPLAQQDLRKQLCSIVEAGFDYVKIDFLSHGAVEGVRYDKSIKTGRQALMYFYNILQEELSFEKTNRDIFISLSIAPLFPCGMGHARRSCCDSFGHNDDTAYVLNALTYGWWINGNLYQYCDPDHTVLYKSIVDGKDCTTLQEAKSRYNASIISGTVMLLSDNYGPNIDNQELVNKAIERAKILTTNEKLNNLARLAKAFKPYSLKSDNNIFYLNIDSKNYVAIFNFENQPQIITIDPSKINVPPQGSIEALSENLIAKYDKYIKIKVAPYDSLIFEIK